MTRHEEVQHRIEAIRAAWTRPDAHMAQCDPAIAELFLTNTRDDVKQLGKAFVVFDAAMFRVREIGYWMQDEAAAMPFRHFAEFLNQDHELLATRILQPLDDNLRKIIRGVRGFTCPTCGGKK